MRKILFFLVLVIFSCNLFGQTISPSSPIDICPGVGQTLTVTGVSPSSYQWFLGNTTVGTNPTYNAMVAGSYSVVINGGGPGDTLGPVIVVLHPKPVANFTFTPNSGCPRRKRKVFFTSTSTIASGTLTYQWNFGDPNSGANNTSILQNPSHNFIGVPGGAAESFIVQLTVTSAFGCTDVKTYTVSFGQFPDASLYDQDNVPSFVHCGAGNFDLTVVNSSATIATNTNYQLFWGDGNTYTNSTFGTLSHTYTTQGYFTLTLVVSGPGNCNDTTDYTVFNGTNPGVGIYSNGATIYQCLPATDTFYITGVSGNSPGTTYTVSFNDGSPDIVFNTPPPPPTFFTHTFTTSSCGATPSGLTPNTFYVRIRAENPCGFLDGSVEPITTITKPTANFTISPDSIICTNTTATFTNTSVNGTVVNNSGVCDQSGIINWVITPITGTLGGWNVTSGNIGLANPAPGNPATWGTSPITVNFTIPGTYSVTLIVRNLTNQGPGCRIDSIRKIVCVQAPPVPSFTANPLTNCNPLVVNFTNTSTALPSCGTVTRNWTVTKTSSTCLPDSSADYVFVSPTNAASLNPIIRFNNEGTYTVTLALTSACGVITSAPQIITVKRKPQFAINGVSNICVGQTISPTTNPQDCSGTISNILWTFSNGTPATSNQQNPGSIIYSGPGNNLVILAITNECGVTKDTIPITISTTPIPSVPSNLTRCTGNSIGPINITSTSPGATFTWSNNNTSIGLAASGIGSPIPVFTATNAGNTPITATITATATLATCSSPASFTITINPLPLAPLVTSPVNYCQNIAATLLTAMPAPGNTLLWYTTATGGTGSATAPTPITTGNGTFLFYVSQVVTATGCEGPRAIITVNVNPSPNISGNTHINPTTCGSSTGSITLTGLTVGVSYTVSYTFNGGPQTANVIAGAGGTVIIQNLPAGIYDNITVTSLGCPSNAVGPITLSDPSTPATPTVSSNSPICAGATLSLGSSTTSAGTVTYTWTGPNSFSAATQNTSIANATIAATGNYFVTATINGCTSLPGSVAIIVNATPLLPTLGSNSPVCTGNTLTLAAATTFASPATYSWMGPNGFSSTLLNATIPNVTAAASGTYSFSITATAGVCASPQATTTVLINPTPNIAGGTPSNPTSCSTTTGSITLTGLIPSQTYDVTYTFNTAPQSTIISASATGVLIITGLGAGNYDNIMVSLNGCTSNQVGPFTLTDPNPPTVPTISNSGPVCSGGSLNLTSTGAPAGVTYNWSGPAGYSSANANPVINPAQLNNAGTYTLSVTLNACISATASTTVVINETPALPTVGSNSPVCTGNTLNLSSTTTFPGALTYSWTGPGGFASSQQNPTIPNVTPAAGGTYSLTITANTGLCPSQQATTPVTVNPTPAITGGVATNPLSCSSATGSITLSGLSALQLYTVNYTFNGGGETHPFTSTASGTLVITGLAAGVYNNINVVLNGCPSNAVGPFTLTDPNPPATPVINNSGPVCSGGTLNLTSTAAPAGATYNWTGPNGYTSGIQNPVINPAQLSDAGTYSLSVTLNACTSATVSTIVIVNETPSAPTAGNDGPVCTGNTLNLSASTTFGGPVQYSWTGPNLFSSNQATATISNITPAANGTYTVTVTSQVGNCISTAATTAVIVNTTPAISNGTVVNPSSCASATGQITLNGLVAGATYIVNYLQDGSGQNATIIANASGQVIINNLTAGVYSGITVSLLGCVSNIAGPFTLTDPNPPAPPVAGSNSSICLGATLNLTAASGAAGTLTYSWTGPDGFTSAVQNPSITNSTVLTGGWYYVNVQVNNCTSLNDSILVVINPLGNLPVAATPVSYCIDNVPSALTATSDPNNTLNWYNVATGGSPLAAAPVPATNPAGSTFYYVSQTTAFGCEGPRTAVEVIIHPDAKALFAPTDTIGCPSFVLTPAIINLQLFPALNSDYEWYANNVLIGTGPVFPGYTLLNENETVTIKLKAISLFGCKNDSISRIFNTYNLPHPVFTMSDSVGCGPLIVQFQNTTPNITQFTYLWDFGNGITSTLEQPGSVTFLSNPTYNDTVYLIKLKVFSICDTLTYTDSVRVKSKPRALFTPSITTGCSPMHVVFTNTSAGNGNTYTWNLDDGSPLFVTNSNDSFSHTFHTGVVDTFYVQLIAVNECGSDSITYAIITAPNNIQLNFSFNGTDAYGCAPHTVAFINNTIGAGSFDWDFGDGNSTITVDNIDTVYHTYLLSGTYTVGVHAQNNCTDTTAIKYITVYPKPIAAFTASQLNICIGQTVQFTNHSDSANAYTWQFGDGTGSALVNPLHAYATAGTYTVTLYSYHNNPDGSSCIDSVNAQVQVTSTLPGNITLSATSGLCVPFTITFINHDIPSVTANWDFGDGNTATGDSVVHTYLVPGVFTVTATVTAPGGCTYNSTQVVTITGPTGTLLYTSGFVCFPDPFRFEAVASGANNLLWNFGDGTTLSANQLVVYHNYTTPGIYIPSVTLQSTGCDYPIQGLDTIKVDRIDAGFSHAEQQHCGYSNIVFTDTSHVFFGESTITWDFGDGNTGTGASVTHQYTASGIYNISMVVTGNSGCTDTVRKQLNFHINNIPVASIIADAVRCANEPVDFLSNIVSADPLSITQWTLSNGATGNTPSFSYLFSQPGTFTLQFIAGTVNGCFDTAYHTITINPVPIITSSSDLTLCLGNSAQLQATGPLPLQWTPIQGLSCTNCVNPIAAPLVTTPYVVSGTNSFGCAGYDTTVITVIQPLQLTVSPADSICIGQSTNLLASGATSYQWSPATGLNSTVISNPTANPVITTNYRVVGYDGYNCFTDTAYILVAIGQYPTVDLGPDLTLATGVMHPLISTITNGPVSQWLWEPATNLTCADCAIPVAEIKKDITYKVTITTAYGCQATDVINLKVFCTNAQVFIPNAFTPNGDGKNDILMVRGQGIVTVKYFRIFNRWGEVVFERNNFPPNDPTFGWDGKINGKYPPPGVYVYTAGVICENGTAFEYKGNTTIIK